MREDFEIELEYFSELYANMNGRIIDDLRHKGVDELEKLILHCDEPDDINCWWAVFKVAPIVKHQAKLELAKRRNYELKNR